MTDTPLCKVERILLWTFIVLHLTLLFLHWGEVTGHDAAHFLKTVHDYRFFEPLPSLRNYYTSYHPPLAFLLVKGLSLLTGNLAAAGQLLSSLSILGVFLLLRNTLRHIGLLETIAGMTFLYVSLSLPLFIHLSRAITYDSLQFFFSLLTLYLSVRLFWNKSAYSLCDKRILFGIFLLAITLTLGLFTKYSGLLNFSLPFLVVFVRFHKTTFRTSFITCCLACALALSAATPFYYARYYLAEESWMPVGMEWQRPEDLADARNLRDRHPFLFIIERIRPPPGLILDTVPIQDSFWHRTWFDIWKADPAWESQKKLSAIVSTFYAMVFLPVFIAGIFLFFLHTGRTYTPLSDIGWLLLSYAILLCVALLSFSYQYPLFHWGVYKAKYIASALLWASYCIAIVIHVSSKLLPKHVRSIGMLIGLLLFMGMNHLLPVY